MDVKSKIKEEYLGNICFLAKNEKGYHNLLRLASYANTNGLGDKRKVDPSALKDFAGDLIVYMGGEESRIGKMILNKEKDEKINDIINLLIDIYGKENIYLEITSQDYQDMPSVKKINDYLIKLSQSTNIQSFVSNNYHYIASEDKDAREMALAIKDGYKMYDEQRRKPKGKHHIASEHEIMLTMQKNGFSQEEIQSLIDTTQEIADEISIDIELWKTLFPNYQTPEDIAKLYEEYKDNLVEKSS
ncbi:MAG: PHP domain-containing protein [bacterium]|nr:PHP domain-containing protein [bacterium]